MPRESRLTQTTCSAILMTD